MALKEELTRTIAAANPTRTTPTSLPRSTMKGALAIAGLAGLATTASGSRIALPAYEYGDAIPIQCMNRNM